MGVWRSRRHAFSQYQSFFLTCDRFLSLLLSSAFFFRGCSVPQAYFVILLVAFAIVSSPLITYCFVAVFYHFFPLDTCCFFFFFLQALNFSLPFPINEKKNFSACQRTRRLFFSLLLFSPPLPSAANSFSSFSAYVYVCVCVSLPISFPLFPFFLSLSFSFCP